MARLGLRALCRIGVGAVLAGLALSEVAARADEPTPAPTLAPATSPAPAPAPPPIAEVSPAQAADPLAKEVGALFEKEEYRSAVSALERLALINPDGFNRARQGFLYLHYGDLARAESILAPIVAKHEETRYVVKGFISYQLGLLAFQLGDFDRAEELLRPFVPDLESRRYAATADHVIAIKVLDTMAQLYRERGEHRLAAQTADDLRTLIRRRGMTPSVELLPELNHGEILLAKGDVAAAEPRLRAARDISEKQDAGVSRALRARVLDALGLAAARRGAFTEAKSQLEQALSMREAVFSPYHPAITRSLDHLTSMYLAEGRVDDALRTSARAADLVDRRAHNLLTMGSERQKRVSTAALQRSTDALISLHLRAAPRSAAAARTALTAILRRKGIVLEAMAGGLSALHNDRDAAGLALSSELGRIDARLSTKISRGPIDATPDDYRADLNDLEEERRALEEKIALRARSREGGAKEQPLLTLEDVQRAIPEGAALVELIDYRPYSPFGPPIRPTWGKPRYAAYIVRRSGDPSWVELDSIATINATSVRFVKELASPSRSPRASARELDALVMEPIRRALRGARWVLLSPDGALNFVPFYALVDEDDRDLIETMSFTYLMSGRDLVRLSAPREEPRQGAMILANPEFERPGDAEPSGESSQDGRGIELTQVLFSPLRGTAEEGQRVHAALERSTLLTGQDATEEAMKAARGPRVLHVATHGFFLPDVEARRPSAAGSSAQSVPWNDSPLLRAGLALYGANRRRSTSDGDDGVLTALEASDLDLRGTRLVVLSACETGVGQAMRGDGVYGLRRALMIAGAETQVMSLWQVDDGATRDLMIRYYDGLAKGGGRSEAMRASQLDVRSAKAHPYYWASFIVAGDGSALDGSVVAPRWTDPMRVSPGPRGCACRAGQSEAPRGAWAAVIALGFAALARRRTARRANAPRA